MRKLEENSVDAIVCDPPYGLKFMGKAFDDLGEGAQQREWHRLWAVEALRVLKPGGHLIAFGGTRTYHHLATAVEEAGFEIRDQIQWLYGSGFPKSLNVGKAIEAKEKTGSSSPTAQRKAAMGKKYKKTPLAGTKDYGVKGNFSNKNTGNPGLGITTEEAARWEGWGTALKPANEPCVLARKPFRGTVAENVQEWGTGAMNIDGCRVGTDDDLSGGTYGGAFAYNGNAELQRDIDGKLRKAVGSGDKGRWPANVILDEEAGELLDEQSGKNVGGGNRPGGNAGGIWKTSKGPVSKEYGDKGGASRFFYCPKAAKKERNAGMPEGNKHPTVKPVKLMAYLIRLVTPPGGTVLDPFLGSGSTGLAAIEEGVSFIGIEKDPEYVKIAKARIAHWQEEHKKPEEK